jgi:hypothetical protein
MIYLIAAIIITIGILIDTYLMNRYFIRLSKLKRRSQLRYRDFIFGWGRSKELHSGSLTALAMVAVYAIILRHFWNNEEIMLSLLYFIAGIGIIALTASAVHYMIHQIFRKKYGV